MVGLTFLMLVVAAFSVYKAIDLHKDYQMYKKAGNHFVANYTFVLVLLYILLTGLCGFAAIYFTHVI